MFSGEEGVADTVKAYLAFEKKLLSYLTPEKRKTAKPTDISGESLSWQWEMGIPPPDALTSFHHPVGWSPDSFELLRRLCSKCSDLIYDSAGCARGYSRLTAACAASWLLTSGQI